MEKATEEKGFRGVQIVTAGESLSDQGKRITTTSGRHWHQLLVSRTRTEIGSRAARRLRGHAAA